MGPCLLLGMVLPSHPASTLLRLSQTCCPTSPLWKFASLLDLAKPQLCLENSYSEKQISAPCSRFLFLIL